MPIYGGAAYDDNGYQTVQRADSADREKMGRQHHRFLVQLVILAAGILTVTGAFAG